MDKDRLKELYLAQIEDYCNVIFDEVPSGVALALEELIEYDPMRYSITSEKLSDMSLTYSDNGGSIPEYIRVWLAPYRRVNLVGNKKKRYYSGCRGYNKG